MHPSYYHQAHACILVSNTVCVCAFMKTVTKLIVSKTITKFTTLVCSACPQVFDTTRKITYKNLSHWYAELRQHRPDIPCILVANKIDGMCKRSCMLLLKLF